jgi:hypothetical protein
MEELFFISLINSLRRGLERINIISKPTRIISIKAFSSINAKNFVGLFLEKSVTRAISANRIKKENRVI